MFIRCQSLQENTWCQVEVSTRPCLTMLPVSKNIQKRNTKCIAKSVAQDIIRIHKTSTLTRNSKCFNQVTWIYFCVLHWNLRSPRQRGHRWNWRQQRVSRLLGSTVKRDSAVNWRHAQFICGVSWKLGKPRSSSEKDNKQSMNLSVHKDGNSSRHYDLWMWRWQNADERRLFRMLLDGSDSVQFPTYQTTDAIDSWAHPQKCADFDDNRFYRFRVPRIEKKNTVQNGLFKVEFVLFLERTHQIAECNLRAPFQTCSVDAWFGTAPNLGVHPPFFLCKTFVNSILGARTRCSYCLEHLICNFRYSAWPSAATCFAEKKGCWLTRHFNCHFLAQICQL